MNDNNGIDIYEERPAKKITLLWWATHLMWILTLSALANSLPHCWHGTLFSCLVWALRWPWSSLAVLKGIWHCGQVQVTDLYCTVWVFRTWAVVAGAGMIIVAGCCPCKFLWWVWFNDEFPGNGLPSGLLGAPVMKALIAEDKICGEVEIPDMVGDRMLFSDRCCSFSTRLNKKAEMYT